MGSTNPGNLGVAHRELALHYSGNSDGGQYEKTPKMQNHAFPEKYFQHGTNILIES